MISSVSDKSANNTGKEFVIDLGTLCLHESRVELEFMSEMS